MEVLLLLLLLIGFWIFVRHDKKRIEQSPPEPLARADMERGFSPGNDAKWHALGGLSILAFIAFIAEVANPSRPPFTGRWGWLWANLFSASGSLGIALYWGLAAAVAGVAAALAYRSGRKPGK